jgi:hypothetical protein
MFLPNLTTGSTFMVDGINLYVRTANGKTARVYGTTNTTSERMYDIGPGNAAAKGYISLDANQNAQFFYYNGYWYYMD